MQLLDRVRLGLAVGVAKTVTGVVRSLFSIFQLSERLRYRRYTGER